jgi:hypothetical protein
MLWGGHRHRSRAPDIQGASASQQHNQVSLESMTVVFMDDNSSAIRDASEEENESNRFLVPRPALLPVARPQISAASLTSIEDTDNHPAEANGDQAGRAMLFGRYMGQVSARIERIWMRPRSVPTDGGFACLVQITQDRAGRVQEITLEKCTDDPRWQMSLVRAINAASPLPVPPDPTVFSNLLRMEFDSDPYGVGRSEDGFEPPAKADAMADPRSSSAPAGPVAAARSVRRLRPDGSLDLTIVGSPAQSTSE